MDADILPVGIPEIAEKLGVKRATVDQWLQRGLLPPRDWTVGGRPAWNWANIRTWARKTARYQGDTMTDVDPLTAELTAGLIAALSRETRGVIAAVVERRIEREYDVATAEQLKSATMLARAGIELDIHRAWVQHAGSDRGLTGTADALLRHLVAEGLAVRLCHCALTHPSGCPHGYPNSSVTPCAGHYEEDVPAIDGALLCGTCHGAEYRKAHPAT